MGTTITRDKRQGKSYSSMEELFNALTHGFGTAVAIAGLVLMIVFSVRAGDGWRLASSIVYGTTMIILYLMSTLYHAISLPGPKRVLRVLDHCSIYLLIAGTYTPFTLVVLRGQLGWWLFAGVWTLTALGIILNAIDIHKFKWVSMALYLAMGWCILFAWKPIRAALPLQALILLLCGGLAYTGGVVFYTLKSKMYMHGVWHLFVLLGSVLHYLCILLYIIAN